jgi:hypothetical protein
MANRFLGEASASVDGKSYTLRLDFNAMCAFEEATGEDAMQMLESLERGKPKGAVKGQGYATILRTLVWCMLKRHHPDATQEEAGDILSSDLEALQRALLAAQPKAPEGAVGNGQSRAKVRPA